MQFIDYEYATPSPAAFDIANHFAEWGGYNCDYSMMPTRSVRRQFLTEYVKSYSQYRGIPDCAQQEIVDRLYEDVDRFRGIPGLYWYVPGHCRWTLNLTSTGACGHSSKPRSHRSTLTMLRTRRPGWENTTPGGEKWMARGFRRAKRCPSENVAGLKLSPPYLAQYPCLMYIINLLT